MKLLDKLIPKKNKVRAKAIQLGITVTDVDRRVPVMGKRDAVIMTRAVVAKYSIERTSNRKSEWRLLRRAVSHGLAFENGYKFTINKTSHEELSKEIEALAAYHDDGYAEFEGSQQEVCLYWTEWGDERQAINIYNQLSRLSAL